MAAANGQNVVDGHDNVDDANNLAWRGLRRCPLFKGDVDEDYEDFYERFLIYAQDNAIPEERWAQTLGASCFPPGSKAAKWWSHTRQDHTESQ